MCLITSREGADPNRASTFATASTSLLRSGEGRRVPGVAGKEPPPPLTLAGDTGWDPRLRSANFEVRSCRGLGSPSGVGDDCGMIENRECSM